jgi:hypothetical protein
MSGVDTELLPWDNDLRTRGPMRQTLLGVLVLAALVLVTGASGAAAPAVAGGAASVSSAAAAPVFGSPKAVVPFTAQKPRRGQRRSFARRSFMRNGFARR